MPFLAIFLLLAAAPVSAASIQVASLTGAISIKTPAGVVEVSAGQPAPEIPAGAEIVVLSGELVVVSGGVSVKAGPGDSFAIGESEGGVTVAATGEKTSLLVTAGRTSAVMRSGDAVAISGGRSGVLAVTAGSVSVKSKGRSKTVRAGESAAIVAARLPAAKKEAPAEIPAADAAPAGMTVPAPSPAQESSVVSPSAP